MQRNLAVQLNTNSTVAEPVVFCSNSSYEQTDGVEYRKYDLNAYLCEHCFTGDSATKTNPPSRHAQQTLDWLRRQRSRLRVAEETLRIQTLHRVRLSSDSEYVYTEYGSNRRTKLQRSALRFMVVDLFVN